VAKAINKVILPRGRESFPVSEPWRWIRQIRAERGPQALIPAIGSGFNAQAVGSVFGWRDLLVEIQRRTQLTFELPAPDLTTGNTTLIWERMLFDLAAGNQRRPHQVEDSLQRVVAQTLRKFYPVGGSHGAFANRFLGLGFQDVLSFNFDEVLLHEDAAWVPKPKPLDPVMGHCRVGSARVWYPHGSVCDPASIQLGLRAYGILIQKLEEGRIAYKATESELFEPRPPKGTKAPRRAKDPKAPPRVEKPRTMEDHWRVSDALRQRALSWVSTAMNAPLIFAGLSLGREEWPLWWFLNQRARNHARRNLSWEIPTFAILIRKEAELLATAARMVNITLVPVDSYHEGWDRLFDALK